MLVWPCLSKAITSYCFRLHTLNLHAGSANRHSRYGKTGNLGLLGQQTIDVGGRNVSFNNIAIHDGGMARLEFGRHLVVRFDL